MAAAQLHSSAAVAAAARRMAVGSRLSPSAPRVSSSAIRLLQNPLAASPKLSISVCGRSMVLCCFEPKISTNCTKHQTHWTEEENFVSGPADKKLKEDQEVAPQIRSAKMHDFCLGIPFGGLLFSMGLLGFFFSRSYISLALGVAPGFATTLLSVLSLKFWKSGRSNLPFIFGQAAVAALLAWKYSQAYLLTNRILPWGFYALLSAAMFCFYSYVLLAGGNPPPKKYAVATLSK